MADTVNDGIKAEMKEMYLSEPSLTLVMLSDMSKDTFGTKVSNDLLKFWSRSEGWGVEKSRRMLGKSGLPTSLAEEADDLRQVVYNTIMDPDSPVDSKDLVALIKTWESIRMSSPRKTTAKTTRQQVIEATGRGVQKVIDFKEGRNASGQ